MKFSFKYWQAKLLNDKNLLRLIVIGFLARTIIFLVFYPEATVFPDSGGFFRLAKKMSTLSLEGYIGKRSPGYPLLILFAFGQYKLVAVYQFLLGILNSLLWYKILLNLKFSRKFSFFTVLVMQSFINVIFYETAIIVESLSLFFISLSVYIITKHDYAKQQSIRKEFYFSLILGFLVLVKPFFVYLPFLIYGLFTLKNFGIKNIINKRIVLLIFPVLMYLGWSYVNKVNTGFFVSTTYLGMNLSQNCVYFAEKAPKEYQWIAKPYAEYREKTLSENRNVAMSLWNAYGEGHVFDQYNLTFSQLTNEFQKYAKATIAANPKDYAEQVIYRSWWDFWKPTTAWHLENFRFDWARSLFSFIWKIQQQIIILVTVLFGVTTLVLSFLAIYKRKINTAFMLACFVIVPSILQGLVTYGTNSKYSYPFDFLMLFVVLLFIKERKQLFAK